MSLSISAPGVGVAGFICLAVAIYSTTLLPENSYWRWIILLAGLLIGVATVVLELKHIQLRRQELAKKAANASATVPPETWPSTRPMIADKTVDVLLAEYQASHMNRDHYHSLVWTIGSVLIPTSIALVGASLLDPLINNLRAVLALAAFSLALVFVWYAYNLHADPWVKKSILRCQEIEKELEGSGYVSPICIHPPIPRLHTLIQHGKQRRGISIGRAFLICMVLAWAVRIAVFWLP